ncbi:MAG: RelA/SpoT family protein [bacterium]|nr:RelA/SpoT family protein [bacterium]
MQFSDLIAKIKEYNPHVDEDLLMLAYEFADDAHRGHQRLNGEDFIQHCLATSYTLATMQMDTPTIIAGLLHEITDETSITIDELSKQFGKDVAVLVEGVSKLGLMKYRGVEKYAENLRKMFIAMAKDIRIIVIKFADRLDNLKTLDALPVEKRDRIAQEVLEIYVPIANRLGMGRIKTQLEDLAFKYVDPQGYDTLRAQVEPILDKKEEYLRHIEEIASEDLDVNGIKNFQIVSRVKNLFSIYKKLQTKNSTQVSGLYDLVALRIIVDTIADCYAVLGIIHQHWKPLPGRIKDYITQPKANNYRGLHTTIFCEGGEIVEFQIRTREMDQEAKFGIAAHWHYDESGKRATTPTKDTEWIEEIISLPQNVDNDSEYLSSLKLDAFGDRIFVFTPQGDVINLPEQSTPVDFAYRIHTDVGMHCVGAKINDTMASLDSTLQSGDVVEILTDKNRKKPNVDWLAFVKTTCARSHIRAQLREV